MAPAECQRHAVTRGYRAIAGIAIDLQHTDEAAEVSHRTFAFAIGRVDIDDARWIGSLPWPVVTSIGPELTGLGLPSTWIKHRGSRLVCEELGRGLESSIDRTDETGSEFDIIPKPYKRSELISKVRRTIESKAEANR